MLKSVKYEDMYTTESSETLKDSFYNPTLSHANTYKRTSGFFSSTIYDLTYEGISEFIKNKGKIKLLTSPILSKQDIEAIKSGLKDYKEVVEDSVLDELATNIENKHYDKLKILSKLISSGVMEIRLGYVESSSALVHEKVGIFSDSCGDKVAFNGSANETRSGLEYNYESISVFTSWAGEDSFKRINNFERSFDRTWNGENYKVKVVEFSERVARKLLSYDKDLSEENIEEIIENLEENVKKQSGNSQIKLRDYQIEAISKWFDNKNIGFFKMATGTGKTWTSIFGIRELIEQHKDLFTTVIVPYKHLVEQWNEDIKTALPNACIINANSDYKDWLRNLRVGLRSSRQSTKCVPVILLITNSMYKKEKHIDYLVDYEGKKLLVVDEAHRFYNMIKDNINKNYDYKLGLSATPMVGKSTDKSEELINFFGKIVFELDLEDALGKFLVNYNYYPIYHYLTDDEEEEFQKYQKLLVAEINRIPNNAQKIGQYAGLRNRVLANASAKINEYMNVVDRITPKNNMLVYCGAGEVYDKYSDNDKRFVNKVTTDLSRNSYIPHQFTSEETLIDRKNIIRSFENGSIQVLVGIKCLDEGINIPKIENAVIISSNNDMKEFVQRRGRILRKSPGKESANIYDLVVLPKSNIKTVANIELRRVYEYARLSSNYEDIKIDFIKYLDRYELTIEELEFMENDIEVEYD